MSQIDYIDDYTAMEIMSRQNAEPSATQIDFKAHGLNFTALIISTDGNIIKHIRPEIKSSEGEIKRISAELDRFKRAVEKKDLELKTLREKEDYNGITTTAGYKREYELKVKNLTLRLEGLRKKIPDEIQTSIENVKKFITLLDAEISAAEEMIKDAEQMKKTYEV